MKQPTAPTIRGRVGDGEKLGRTIGYPTANLPMEAVAHLTLGDGVYACWVEIEGRTPVQLFRGALIVGAPSATRQPKRKLEVYLLDFNENLYGRTLVIEVVRRLRDLIPSDESIRLRVQIEEDLAQIRTLLSYR